MYFISFRFQNIVQSEDKSISSSHLPVNVLIFSSNDSKHLIQTQMLPSLSLEPHYPVYPMVSVPHAYPSFFPHPL